MASCGWFVTSGALQFSPPTTLLASFFSTIQAWQQAGGYDSRLFFCWEEFYFCLRAIALGWRVRYRGDIVIRHKVAAERRVDWSSARWFYFVRNRLYIERKLGRSARETSRPRNRQKSRQIVNTRARHSYPKVIRLRQL